MSTTPPAFNGTSYTLTGPVDAPAVVFIHGLGLCRDVFAGMLPAFAGYRVLTYDLYGHGASEKSAATASLSVYAGQLAGLSDHLGVAKVHVVGFSIGGMINRRFALDYPERVASLTILNSPHDRGTDAQAQVEARALAARDQGAFATFDAALKRWFTPAYLGAGDGPALVRNWREMVDDDSYAQAAWVLANGVVELTGREGEITTPTLVMTCENDSGSTPDMSHDIASEIAGAQTIIVPALQHLGLMETPSAFTTPILQFLADQ
ncbi:MAG: alpha/beta fold hydrolase [Yoonia sp.]